MIAKPPFVQLSLTDTKPAVTKKAKAVRRALKQGHHTLVRVYVPNRRLQSDGEDMLLTFCARVGALPQGKWNWKGKVLDTILVKGL